MLDLSRIERAFTHALESSLGKLLKPKTHRGVEDASDVEAIAALLELRKEINRDKKTA